ncbi:MAG: mechanosensitive ion channel family protein [Candidatus Babeliales bacterium]
MISSCTVLNYSLHAIRIILIALVGWWVVRYLKHRVKTALAHIYPDDLRVELIARVFSYTALLIVVAALFNELGIQVSALLGAAGIVGVALGFAAQTSVANIISGLFLMIEQPFELGDQVSINGIEGMVIAVNLFAVTLKTEDGRQVRIPHEQILKNNLINITGLPMRRYDVTLRINYQQNPERVIRLIEDTLKQIPQVLTDPAPYILVKNMTGDYWEVVVGVWGEQDALPVIKKSVLITLKDAFDKQGIALSVPRYGE